MSEELIDVNIENIQIVRKVNPRNEKLLGGVRVKNMIVVQQIIKNIFQIRINYIVKIQ